MEGKQHSKDFSFSALRCLSSCAWGCYSRTLYRQVPFRGELDECFIEPRVLFEWQDRPN